MVTTSIILTINNKAFLLPRSLEALKICTNWDNSEVIFVVDGCTDNSYEIVKTWRNENVGKIKAFVTRTPNVFETKANNSGAAFARGEYLIFLQDDQIISDMGWNIRILEPFKKFDDVFAVSGNCAHNWEINPNSVGINSDGWNDMLLHTNHATKENTPRNIFAVRDSCNRGPLAINRADFELLGRFDEKAIDKQDMDDHLLIYDAKKKLNKVVGFYAINFYSESHWGGTRDESGKPRQWSLDCQNNNVKTFIERHKDILHIHTVEDRVFKP